jgi:hypothetical protein
MQTTFLRRKLITVRNLGILRLTLALAIFGLVPGLRAQLTPPPFVNGDFVISAQNSQVFVYSSTGTPKGVLTYTTAPSARTGGLAFDHMTQPNLLVALPDATATGDVGTVGQFTSTGAIAPPFGSGYGGNPFSMVVDRTGNVFVGEEGNDLGGDLLKFSPTGALIPPRYAPAVEGMGVKWVDLACNPSTPIIFYTSLSRAIKRFNTSGTGSQLQDFVLDSSLALVPAPLVGPPAPYTGPLEAVKIVPDSFPTPTPGNSVQAGQVIAAQRDPNQGLLRFNRDTAGNVTIVRNYIRPLAANPAVFVGLSFDPNLPTVWTIDLVGTTVDPVTGAVIPEAVEFDVDSGAEVSSFPLTGVRNAEAITIKNERLCGNPLPPPSMCGRMYGGGSFPISNGTNAYHGFTLSDVNNPPNRMTVSWKDSNGNTQKFCLTQLTSALLYDDPTFTPNPPRSGFDSYQGTGTGTINGVAGATATWTFTDKGDPGTNDTVNMQIKNAAGTVVMTTVGTVKQNSPCGNHHACPCPTPGPSPTPCPNNN